MRSPNHCEGIEPASAFGGFLNQLAQGAAQLRGAKQLRFRRAMTPAAPAPGTIEYQRQQMEWARTLPNVKDFRNEGRLEVDRVWDGFASECRERFGVSVSTDPSGHADAGVRAALKRERETEAAYLALQGAPHAGGASVVAARTAFIGAVAKFATAATAGLPSANERARGAARAERIR